MNPQIYSQSSNDEKAELNKKHTHTDTTQIQTSTGTKAPATTCRCLLTNRPGACEYIPIYSHYFCMLRLALASSIDQSIIPISPISPLDHSVHCFMCVCNSQPAHIACYHSNIIIQYIICLQFIFCPFTPARQIALSFSLAPLLFIQSHARIGNARPLARTRTAHEPRTFSS